MPPSRLFSASRLWGGTRPWGRETTLAGTLTGPSCAGGSDTTSLAQAACEAQSCYPVDPCGAPVTDDDRPRQKKSWREIDKMRDRGGPSRRDQRERESFERSTG